MSSTQASNPLTSNGTVDYGSVTPQEEKDPAAKLQVHQVGIYYTPYSDIDEQEDFAANYRRKIFLLYLSLLPSLAVSAAFLSILLGKSNTAFLWVSFAAVSFLVCACVTIFAKPFEPLHFINRHLAFFLWPVIPFAIGFCACIAGNEKDAAFGFVLTWFSIFIVAVNSIALALSHVAEEDRLERWPPLPDHMDFV